MRSAVSSRADRAAPAPAAVGSCAVLIPAYNEAATIAQVVGTAFAAGLGPVLVVDDGSQDDTVARATQAGARVLELGHNRGKGGAVYAGALELATDVVVLIDADLIGLCPHHLRALAEPVLSGAADMTRGVFTGGRWSTTAAQHLAPQLNGQRAVRRELLASVPNLAVSRYGVEVAITEAARRDGWRTVDVPLEGVSQVMKEEKRGFLAGFMTRIRMYGEILFTLLRRP